MGGVLVHYTRITAEVYELRRLRAENQVLTQKTLEYEQNAGKLQAKVAYLHSIVSKLGIMAGLDHALPDATVGGEGGVTSFETVAPSRAARPSLADMDLSVSALTDKSTRLEVFYRDQTLLLSSTPSGNGDRSAEAHERERRQLLAEVEALAPHARLREREAGHFVAVPS